MAETASHTLHIDTDRVAGIKSAALRQQNAVMTDP